MTIDNSKFLLRKEEAKYDSSCPYYSLLWEDLLYGSPFYDHYCTLQFNIDIAGSDYAFCDKENYNSCPVFLNEMVKRQKELINLEGAD